MHRDFREAVREGLDTIRLTYLLSQGANLDSIDTPGLTALYYASFRGDVRTVRFLLECGANVNVDSLYYGTPIAIAALRCHPEVVKLLLQHKARVLGVAAIGSAIHCACYGGNIDIFTAIMLEDPSNDYLSLNRIVKLKEFSMLSAADHVPSLTNEEFSQGAAIRCTPIFLAAERCRFDILSWSWSELHFEYFSLKFWNFPDEGEVVELRGTARDRIKSSYSSVESRSGFSYVSKASTSSAWSTLGFALAPSEPYQSTLLMWAAASLNFPLLKHLLEAGAHALTPDRAGRTALHYAATPFEDATFKDVGACVELLLADSASFPTAPSIQIGLEPAPQISLMPPLNLVVRANHKALDPRVSYKWGSDIHRTCISSFLDPLPTDEERSRLAQGALLHALSHHLCPAESIELLCKHATKPRDMSLTFGSMNTVLNLEPWSMDKTLNCALGARATEPVITMLLNHGASANTEHNQLPLIAAIASRASEAVLSTLLQHGADPNLRQCSKPNLTAIEYARRTRRRDVVNLFESRSRQSYHTLQRSVEPAAAELSHPDHRDFHYLDLNFMKYVSGMDELDDLEEVDKPDGSEHDCHDRTDTPEATIPTSTRFWIPRIPRFPR